MSTKQDSGKPEASGAVASDQITVPDMTLEQQFAAEDASNLARIAHIPDGKLREELAGANAEIEQITAMLDEHEGLTVRGLTSLETNPDRIRELLRPQTESGWCIERGEAHTPQYLTVCDGCWQFLADHTKALRFSRERDANIVASLFDNVSRVAEHAWEPHLSSQAPITEPASGSPQIRERLLNLRYRILHDLTGVSDEEAREMGDYIEGIDAVLAELESSSARGEEYTEAASRPSGRLTAIAEILLARIYNRGLDPKEWAMGDWSAKQFDDTFKALRAASTPAAPERNTALAEDYSKLRRVGSKLAEAAMRVCREYDGTHRLLLAVGEWTNAVAGEGGRAAAGQEEREWRVVQQYLSRNTSGILSKCREVARGLSPATAQAIVAAHNASLREKEEAKNIQALADHEGLLQCRKLLNVQAGDNLYDAIKRRLSAEPEPSEQKATQAPQMVLRKVLVKWNAIIPRFGCSQCSETEWCSDCDERYQAMEAALAELAELVFLSENDPKSSDGPGASSSKVLSEHAPESSSAGGASDKDKGVYFEHGRQIL